MSFLVSLVPALKQQFNELINGKSQTNRDQKPYYFYNEMINLKKFQIKLLKTRQKTLQRH